MTGEKFHVFQWFANGHRKRVLEYVGAEQAVRCATDLAIKAGTTIEVMITDMEDCAVWHWKHKEGMIFPIQFKGMWKEK